MDTRYQLNRGDAVEWLRTLAPASVDLLITDPPYESLEKHRAVGTTTRLKHSKASSNNWFSIFRNERFPELFAEVFRVLKKDAHFYLYCDPETMFVAKPLAEQAGFKFWKPIIWDKCVGPDTLVWTERGTMRIADVQVGDRVAIPEGGSTRVRATRRTRSHALRLKLSDNTELVASREHRFMRANGELAEARELVAGDEIGTRPVRQRVNASLDMDRVIPADDAVYELPAVDRCVWCDRPFESARAASAHQARFCEAAEAKAAMAEELGISAKRLGRWLGDARLPKAWADALGFSSRLGARVQCTLQNDVEIWYPRTLPLDYELGKVVGLYAAEGSMAPYGVTFAAHASERHLHDLVSRFARSSGIRADLHIDSDKAVVDVNFKIMGYLIEHFIGGRDARTTYFKPSVYAGPAEFRRGVLDGLIDGDGHWSHDEQRGTFTSASADLAMFARRELAALGRAPSVERFENDPAGGWRVRFDPMKRAPLTILAVEDIGEQELVDVSIDDRDELFLLANGAITHNCKIGMGYHYRARYECILFFEKGKRKLNDLGVADVLQFPRVMHGYPAEKPVEVSEILVRQSTEPGQLVVDPFMGSASVGVAAVRLGRSFAGSDVCDEAVEIAHKRLGELGATDANDLAPLRQQGALL